MELRENRKLCRNGNCFVEQKVRYITLWYPEQEMSQAVFLTPSLLLGGGIFMEKEQLYVSNEKLLAEPRYSPLANAELLAADIQLHGEISAASRERVWNESVTFLLEGLNAPLTTRFERQFGNGDMYAEDGTSVATMLQNGLKSAEYMAAIDPRLEFEVTRRRAEIDEHEAVAAMMSSDATTVVSISGFPQEAAVTHGTELLATQGYQADRRLGFLRIYNKLAADQIETVTLSIDNCELRALEGAFGGQWPAGAFASTSDLLATPVALSLDRQAQEDLPGVLRAAYDRSLRALYPQEVFFAGRKNDSRADSSELVAEYRGVFTQYINGVELLASALAGQGRFARSGQLHDMIQRFLHAKDHAGNPLLPREEQQQLLRNALVSGYIDMETAKIIKSSFDFSVWATLRRALAGEQIRVANSLGELVASGAQEAAELVAAGETFISCGGAVNLSAQLQQQSQIAERFLTLTGKDIVLKCVNCPFCKKMVDAKKTATTITCNDCHAQVNHRTGDVVSQGRSRRILGKAAMTNADAIVRGVASLFGLGQPVAAALK